MKILITRKAMSGFCPYYKPPHCNQSISYFFVICILLLSSQTLLINGAINIHRNFGEDFLLSIKEHVYVDSSYTIDYQKASPTCNSLEDAICHSLDLLHDQDNSDPTDTQIGDSETSHYRRPKDLLILPSVNGTWRHQPRAAMSRNPALPVFEREIGDTMESESFAVASGDAVAWLLSKSDVLNRVWQIDKERTGTQEEKEMLSQQHSGSSSSSSDETARRRRNKVIASLTKLQQTRATQFSEGESSPNTEQAVDASEGSRWLSFGQWTQRLDRFAETMRNLILTDGEDDGSSRIGELEEDDEDEDEVQPGSDNKADNKEKDDARREKTPENFIWTASSHFVNFTNFPVEGVPNSAIPEYYGSSSELGLRWIGNWKFEAGKKDAQLNNTATANDHRVRNKQCPRTKTTRNHELGHPPCAGLHNSSGFIIFSKPVLLSKFLLRRIFSHTSDISSELTKEVRIEGWVWKGEARRSFGLYQEINKLPNGSDEWLYSSLPVEKLQENLTTRSWIVTIDLQSIPSESSASQIPFLWDRIPGVSREVVNVIDRISGSPYSRIDGISIRRVVQKPRGKPSSSQQQKRASDPGSLQTEASSEFSGSHKIGATPRSSGSSMVDLCLQNILMRRPVANYETAQHKLIPMLDSSVWESAAVKPGVIIRDMDYDSTLNDANQDSRQQQQHSFSSVDFSVSTNPKILDFHDRMKLLSSSQSILRQQRLLYRSQISASRHHVSQYATLSPPFSRVSPNSRMLPVPDISSDGVVLSQDWRLPMKRIEIILQRSMPIEATVSSLSDVHKFKKALSQKPSAVTSVSLTLPSRSHPGPVASDSLELDKDDQEAIIQHLIAEAVNRREKNDRAEKDDEDDLAEQAKTELTILKRKLVEATKTALEKARRVHDITRTTRRIEDQHQHNQGEPGRDQNSLAAGERDAAATVMMDNTDQLPSLSSDKDWEELSQTIGTEVSASLRAVIREHQQQHHSSLNADPNRLNPSLLQTIDVIELVHKNGEIVAKRMTFDLTSPSDNDTNERDAREASVAATATAPSESRSPESTQPVSSPTEEARDGEIRDLQVPSTTTLDNNNNVGIRNSEIPRDHQDQQASEQTLLKQDNKEKKSSETRSQHPFRETDWATATKLDATQIRSLIETLQQFPEATVTISEEGVVSVEAERPNPNSPDLMETILRTYSASGSSSSFSSTSSSSSSNKNSDDEENPEIDSTLVHEEAALLAREVHDQAHADALRLQEVIAAHRLEQQVL